MIWPNYKLCQWWQHHQFHHLLIETPGQNQKCQLQSSQESESSCFWRFLGYFLLPRSLTYKIKILWLSLSERVPICFPTYEVGVVSIEGNKEAEEVAHRHNQLKKLIEGQNLQIRGMFCFYFVRLPSAPPLPPPMPPRSSSCRRWHSCAGWSWSRSLQQMLSSNL